MRVLKRRNVPSLLGVDTHTLLGLDETAATSEGAAGPSHLLQARLESPLLIDGAEFDVGVYVVAVQRAPGTPLYYGELAVHTTTDATAQPQTHGAQQAMHNTDGRRRDSLA